MIKTKAKPIESHPMDNRVTIGETTVQTLTQKMGTGGGNVPLMMEDKTICIQGNHVDRDTVRNGCGFREDVSFTLNTQDRHAVYAVGNGQADQTKMSEKVGALNAMHDQQCVYEVSGDDISNPYEEFRRHCRVRRLVELECERLQGMPDEWTDIPPMEDNEITHEDIEFFRSVWLQWDTATAKDGEEVKPRTDKQIEKWLKSEPTASARYKALGNGIATPFWKVLIKRISAQYDRDATMGSLFDGIGSFPYLWEQINGKGSCLWSSEIEPFPIKVTYYRFGGNK